MTNMKKIQREAGTNAHHNDELQDLGDGGQKPEVKHFKRFRLHQGRPSWTVEQPRALLRSAVSASLIGDQPDHRWWQVSTGVHIRSVGFHTA